MDTVVNIQSGERLSFYKLFSQKTYRIQVPIIQRDYAQGRKSTKEVRDTFLEALYKYLDEGKPNRDLDFVYGSLSTEDGITNFIPLDGQQRLTTLFLLHWYLYQISVNAQKKEAFKNALLNDGKSMFTYQTRSSSSEFCDALMASDIDFGKLLTPDTDSKKISQGNSLSKTIKNSPWFYLSWQYDPTIQSMLTMLDAIHKRFEGCGKFFERLTDIDNPVITFLFLNLQDFKLTDDLYIKMNSRGKPLTPFENFKAKFEQYLDTITHDRKFSLEHEDGQMSDVPLKDYFSYNIDTTWANLFWNYRTLVNRSQSETDDTFDDELMNFIRVIFASQYAMDADLALKDRDYVLEYLFGTQVAKRSEGYNDVISFHKYEALGALTNKSVLFLVDALNALVNGNDGIMHYLKNYEFYFDEEAVFKHILKHDNSLSNHQRICFHAYIRFLIYNSGNTAGIEQWMRVIHNLTHPENTPIDSASEVAAAIRSIENLLPYSGSILDFLKQDQDISFFARHQVFEEKIKAHLATRNPAWKSKIESTETHGYFNGQIGFILEFAGILEYYATQRNCEWTDLQDAQYFQAFSDYADKARVVFAESYDNRVNDENYVFERAVLTKGDYLTEATQNRWNLLSTSLVKNNIKRDHSWKRLLRVYDDGLLPEKHQYVKQVFDDPRLDVKDPVTSLEHICGDRTGDWRDYFIELPALTDFCGQGFVRFDGADDILLYAESQSNHFHVEMYSYYLWKKIIESRQKSYMPFKDVDYDYVRSIEDKSGVVFTGFCYDRIKYEMKLRKHPFKLSFRKSARDNSLETYGDDIKLILVSCGFEWSEERSCYLYVNEDYKNLISTLDKLVAQLRGL